jgi:thiol:disulfide interchange protein
MVKRLLFTILFLIPLVSIANPLPADEAFKLSVKPTDPNTVLLKWVMPPNYFLYKDCLQVINDKNNKFR